MWQGVSLLFYPEMIVPGLFGLAEKLHIEAPAQHALLRAFGFQVGSDYQCHGIRLSRVTDMFLCTQTLAMGMVSAGAAFRYDTKHKAILNGVLLLFHAVTFGDLVWSKWYSAEASGFRIGESVFLCRVKQEGAIEGSPLYN